MLLRTHLLVHYLIALASLPSASAAFTVPSTQQRHHSHFETSQSAVSRESGDPNQSHEGLSRRSFFSWASAGISAAAFAVANPLPAKAIPMVKVSELESILRDSARSVQLVEFSGPKAETVLVRLVDGTSFGLSDVIESAVDPRSPLKVAAMCREYKVPTKFTLLESALQKAAPQGAEKKRKVYMNQREVAAAEKEKAKRERLRQDEEDRLAELYRREVAEEAATK